MIDGSVASCDTCPLSALTILGRSPYAAASPSDRRDKWPSLSPRTAVTPSNAKEV